MRRPSRWQRGLDATRSKDEIDLLKPEGEMTINKLRAAYTNMNEDKDEDKDKEEKASSGGDESAGGHEEEMDEGG